jgi:hypothetical protein
MAIKPDFVDLISDRTRQNRRQSAKKVVATSDVREEKRLSHWPPDRMEQWRLVNLTPWKMKLRSWKYKDWV